VPVPRVTRRTLLQGAAAGGLSAYLAACGGSSSKLPPASSGGGPAVSGAVPGPPAGGGVRGGRVVNAFDVEGNGYDPAIAYTSTGWEAICDVLYSPLYSYDTDNSPRPNAAAAMPKVSSDGTVYTIPLRPDVKFHNGRAVVAADYKYAWERVLDPKIQSWAASYIYTIKGAKELYRRQAQELVGVEAVDDHTLRVTLVQPDITFVYALTQPFMAPVPKEEVDRLGDNFADTPVGNGPFKVGTYDSQGQRYVFTRFADYYWKGLPYLDEVEFRWGIDQSVQLLMMQRGEVDLMGYGLNAQSLAETRASDRLKKYRFEQPLLASRWINTHPRVEAFRDPRVRQALNWATDRDQLERVTGGEAVAWGAPFPKDILGGKRTFQPYTLDLDKARSLLSEAGSPQIAFTLWVSDSPEPQVGQVLQQQWKEIGVDVTLKQASYATINDLSIKDKCDSWVSTYYAIYPTAIDVISQYWETGGSANYTHYSNADVDRLTTEARATNDPNARNALLAQVEQKVGEDAAGVFCENVNWIMARNPDRLRNFSYSGVYGAYYDRLWVAT